MSKFKTFGNLMLLKFLRLYTWNWLNLIKLIRLWLCGVGTSKHFKADGTPKTRTIENSAKYIFEYRKVASSRLSRSVAHFHIFRLFIKEKFDAYVLWPLAQRVQNWIVDRSTACNFTVCIKISPVRNIWLLYCLLIDQSEVWIRAYSLYEAPIAKKLVLAIL